ncbi:hypothetical protein BH09ACT4_BH09ACT4_03740 [soil metagenome]
MSTRTRIAVLTIALLALPVLAACSAPAPTADPTSAPVVVADIAGEWDLTRTLSNTTVTNEGIAVGTVDMRAVMMSDVNCDDTGACTGTFISARSFYAADQSAATPAALTFDGTTLTVTFPTQPADCLNTDGSIGIAGAYEITSTYTLTADDADATGFTGTLASTVTTVGDAVGTGCAADGDRDFDVTMARHN